MDGGDHPIIDRHEWDLLVYSARPIARGPEEILPPGSNGSSVPDPLDEDEDDDARWQNYVPL